MAPGFGGGEEIFLRKVLEAIAAQESSADVLVLTDSLNHDSYSPYERARLKSAKQISKVVADEELDLVFSPVANAPHRLPVPLVVLVMDLYEAESGVSKRKFWAKGNPQRGLRELSEEATMLLVSSEFIKRELLHLYTVPLNKVTVAPMGVDACFFEEQRCIVEQPYILAVGKVSPRKNLERLRDAFDSIKDDIEHTLVIVGQPGDREPKSWGDKVFRIDRLGTTQLAGLYQHCDFYVCPSLYEGAGITVLEAFAGQALVCAAKVGGIAEVGGNAPIYFNPESVDSMIGVLKRAIGVDASETRRRVQEGKQQLIDHTWDNCASKTLSAFRKSLTGH